MTEDLGGRFGEHDSRDGGDGGKRKPISLSRYLLEFRTRYLKDRKTSGGTAKGFRIYIGKQYETDRLKFDSLVLDALMEAATRSWERPARRSGPDLFAIAGSTLPEFFTRPKNDFPADDGEEGFEKVHQEFANINDAHEDAIVGMRNAARASASAEEKMRVVDEARRRAKGKMTVLLRDIVDDK
jgi:hypothetical protein